MINGFGLQNLGNLALRNPIFFTIVLLVMSAIAALGVTRLQFSGENVEILRDGSKELADYDLLLSSFRNFNNDAVILMQVDDLATVEGIETLRELSFEFQLDERVESILSIFALVQYDGPVKGWASALPAEFETDDQVREALKELVEYIPSAQSLFSPNLDSAVIVVYTKDEAIADSSVGETMDGFLELAREYETDDIKVSIAGQPAIRSGLIDNIFSDLIVLAPVAFLLCAILAFILFRQPVAMVLCALPSALCVLWFLGAMGLSGTELNFLTNILPVLLIVMVFANTLHLYLKWQRLCSQGLNELDALEASVNEIGPACAISCLTTAAALLSLCASGNHGLFELGVVGSLAVMGGFVSVIAGLPIAAHWAARGGFHPRPAAANSLAKLAKPAMGLLGKRTIVIPAGLILCFMGLYAHAEIDSRFRLIDYLGSKSQIGQSEVYIDQTYSGTTPLFAIVQLDEDQPLLADENERRVYGTLDSILQVFPAGSFYSLVDFAEEIQKQGAELDEALIDELPRFLTSRFISEDKRKILITIFSSANLSASEIQARLAELKNALGERELEEIVSLTGYPVLSGVVAPRLMDNLRISLLLALGLAIFVIALAARSLRLGFACLVPNLLPIVCVELVLFLAGIPLNMSITVALTVAFGIAVDDSIHMLNQYMINRQLHDRVTAVAGALKEVTPAIFSTTLILSGGLLVMSFSTLPAMAVFSAVVIMTLVFAFLADIFQLPSYLAIMERD